MRVPKPKPSDMLDPELANKSVREIANDLRKVADQAALEAEISDLVKQYGRELRVGMTFHQAMEIIKDCLADGLVKKPKSALKA